MKKNKEKLSQKQRIKEALKGLQNSNRLKVEVKLDSADLSRIRTKSLPRIWYNKSVFFVQQWIVPMHFKNWLLRTTGMDMGHDCCIPHYIKFDPYFPELIHIGAGTLIGGDSTLISHEIKGKTLVLGKVIFPKQGMCGGMVTVRPGSSIGKNAILSMDSEFTGGIIPEGEIWYGRPAVCTHKMGEDEIKKFFAHTGENPKEYYRKFYKAVKEFKKDKTKTYFKMQYGGNRLGAGNDWWRARNVVRIFYNGIIVEFTKLLPHSWFKTLLLRMIGVKIGRNCRIGKGCIFDHINCDTITLEDNVVLEDNCYFDGHEYTIAQSVFGRIRIGKGTRIKHNSYARTGTQIGENVVIEPKSFLQREIPSNEVWGGVPAKFIRKR
ncbi:hypothetical protein COV19_03540 [Candidatus Woesearchaeota archaeon CG10_big_fil_rev_8_21_14_0_10_44_13]|nr:MAG: hypothetical protein COV19_03540 [Candidatus Woesearchaeota archaeon CG10_big_fil_rev_8_21_14_0_10_44_13]